MSIIIFFNLCVILTLLPETVINRRTRTTYQFKNSDILRIYNASRAIPPEVQNYVPIYEAMTPPPWGEVNISGVVFWKTISNEPVIPASQFEKPPRFSWAADHDKFHLFFLTHINVDFDVWGYYHYHHWIVGNIPGCDMAKGQVLIPYLPPIGEQGLWRPNYRLVVFEQHKKIDYEKIKIKRPKRTFTTIDKFIAKFNLANNLKATRTFFVDDDNGATTPRT